MNIDVRKLQMLLISIAFALVGWFFIQQVLVFISLISFIIPLIVVLMLVPDDKSDAFLVRLFLLNMLMWIIHFIATGTFPLSSTELFLRSLLR